MATLQELTKQRAALDAEIERLQTGARAEAIAQIKAIMTEYGLEAKDLSFGQPVKRKSSTVAAKYRNVTTGETWSGRGLQPKWLRSAISGGATLEDFKL